MVRVGEMVRASSIVSLLNIYRQPEGNSHSQLTLVIGRLRRPRRQLVAINKASKSAMQQKESGSSLSV